MTDTSTIIIYRAKDGYRFRLISPENKKIVGSAVKSFKNKEAVLNELLILKEILVGGKGVPGIYVDKAGKFRFRVNQHITPNPADSILLVSEAYTQKHNAIAGIGSCYRAMQIGLVSCIACENTDVIPLADMPQAAIERNWFNEES